MICHYCAIERAGHRAVLTRLGHCVRLCRQCARDHAIVRHRPRREKPPARDKRRDRRPACRLAWRASRFAAQPAQDRMV